MTEAEKVICKLYLEDLDKYHACNEYKLLMQMLEQEPNTDGDCIRRQAALDIVDSYSESQSNVEDVTQDIISDIVVLPPVNPQEKTGHWIYWHTNGFGRKIYKCSKCNWDGDSAGYNFCPNCGAKMESEV